MDHAADEEEEEEGEDLASMVIMPPGVKVHLVPTHIHAQGISTDARDPYMACVDGAISLLELHLPREGPPEDGHARMVRRLHQGLHTPYTLRSPSPNPSLTLESRLVP